MYLLDDSSDMGALLLENERAKELTRGGSTDENDLARRQTTYAIPPEGQLVDVYREVHWFMDVNF